jgi:transposase
MDDRALYATILGVVRPWEVTRVELDDAAKVVHVWLTEYAGTTFTCPDCDTVSPLHDHVERSWRHLDTCQYETQLHAKVPRVRCAEHGVKTVPVPWAAAHSRFTMLFERLAIAWLKEATPAAVARRLGLTWEEANGIVERAVRRGLERRASVAAVAARYLGIDEHSYLKHFEFVTMVVNLETQTVLHVANDRTAETLASYFDALSIDDRLAIEAIAMDMWDPYRKAVRDYVPDGDTKIVFDRFHVMRHVTEAMDQVRRRENRVLRQHGDKRLTGTKFLWLKTRVGGSDFTAASRRQFRALRKSTLKSARAWAMKDAFRHIWDYRSIPAARAFFARWEAWARRSRLRPMIHVAGIIRRHLENVLNYLNHRITNAVTEGLNAKIQWIKYSSRGFRDRERFKLAIYFHCGGLDLDPR